MKQKPNFLILGASGGVANAVLHYLSHHRDLFSRLILIDKNSKILKDPFIDHKGLDYKFEKIDLKFPEKESEYLNILKNHQIDIVLDLTDADSAPLLEATNKAGISYVNTALNSEAETAKEILPPIYAKKDLLNNAAHILCAGMNPGNVNMWARYGIEKFGVPQEIIHMEYDTSKIASHWHPAVTWSLKEFLVECVRDPGGKVLAGGKIVETLPNALQKRVYMKNLLSPVMKLKQYPYGFMIIHEENFTISKKYGVPSKFIYAIHTKTMDNLIKIYSEKGAVTREELCLADNTTEILDGSDSIGVMLDYPDKKVYYWNSVPNVAMIGTSATYFQVAVGVFSALFTLLFDDLEKRVHFTEELFDTHFKHYMFDNLRVEEFIFEKSGRKLKLKNYTPAVKIRRHDKLKHIYI